MTRPPTKWFRVRKSNRCPICGRPDWCGISEDGTAANCARTPNNRPIKGRNGDIVGYLHKLDGLQKPDYTVTRRSADEPTRQDIAAMAERFRTAVNPERLAKLADALDLSRESLRRLRVGYDHDKSAWAFPMVDASMNIVGIRYRTLNGKKFSVKGGKEGLFIPDGINPETLLICEGATSCAALLDLGMNAIGRPSCNGGVAILCDVLIKIGRRNIVIVGDHDTEKVRPDGSTFYPGQDGAKSLACEIAKLCRSVKIIMPPFEKDARDWKRSGATAAVVMAIVKAARYFSQ